LTSLGRDELRTQQRGFQTVVGFVQLPIWRPGRDRLSEVAFETTILDLTNAIVNALPFRDAWSDPWQDLYTKAIVDSDSENESDEQASPARTADRLTEDDTEADESEEEDADEDQENIDEKPLKQFIARGHQNFLETTRRFCSE
jgi:hypothetical protein